MNLQTIDNGSAASASTFQKYFSDSDLFELFEFDPERCDKECKTLDMILE